MPIKKEFCDFCENLNHLNQKYNVDKPQYVESADMSYETTYLTNDSFPLSPYHKNNYQPPDKNDRLLYTVTHRKYVKKFCYVRGNKLSNHHKCCTSERPHLLCFYGVCMANYFICLSDDFCCRIRNQPSFLNVCSSVVCFPCATAMCIGGFALGLVYDTLKCIFVSATCCCCCKYINFKNLNDISSFPKAWLLLFLVVIKRVMSLK